MATYKFKINSWLLWIPVSLIIMAGCIFWLREIIHTDTIATYLSILGVVPAVLFLPRFLSRATMEIGLNDNSISIKWLKQFLFHNRPDREIFFKDIQSFKCRRGGGLDLFKLTLKDGAEIKFWHFNSTRGDGFTQFLFEFNEKVFNYNKDMETMSLRAELLHITKISREKTFYEKGSYPFIAGFGILLLIVVLLILYVSSSGRISGVFLGIAAAAIFYGFYLLNSYSKYHKRYTNE